MNFTRNQVFFATTCGTMLFAVLAGAANDAQLTGLCFSLGVAAAVAACVGLMRYLGND